MDVNGGGHAHQGSPASINLKGNEEGAQLTPSPRSREERQRSEALVGGIGRAQAAKGDNCGNSSTEDDGAARNRRQHRLECGPKVGTNPHDRPLREHGEFGIPPVVRLLTGLPRLIPRDGATR